jgi:hypothetical protein
MRRPSVLVALLAAAPGVAAACAIDDFDCRPRETASAEGGAGAEPVDDPHIHRLPFLGAAARERGYELPRTYGAALTYMYLSRDIEVTDVRIGRNGAEPQSVSEYAQLSARSEVDNYNVKLDAWVLPFLDVYAIVGTVANQSQTTIEVTLPPLLPNGPTRTRSIAVPTSLDGSVGGFGVTAAGGYEWFFGALDVNWARADLGFDDEFEAIVASLRLGWNGKAGAKPLRVWLNATHWDTAFEVKGSVADDDGGELRFEVDQGPAYAWTYGIGMQYSPRPWFDVAMDSGWDLEGGWYVALVPTVRW